MELTFIQFLIGIGFALIAAICFGAMLYLFSLLDS